MNGWDGRCYPHELRDAERILLADRARALGRRLQGDTTRAPDVVARLQRQHRLLEARHAKFRYVGLALSGGGIRSATFSLGFLQGLARLNLLREVDYLSTVSGGSYIGGFLGALFDRRRPPPKAASADAPATSGAPAAPPPAPLAEGMWDVEAELSDPRSRVVDWLRDNGRYLSPAGAADGWAALAVILRNLVAVHVVLWTLVLTVFVWLDVLRGGLSWALAAAGPLPGWAQPVAGQFSGSGVIWWSPALLVPALVIPLALFPLGLAYWIVPEGRGRRTSDVLRRISLLTNGLVCLAGLALVGGSLAVDLPTAALVTGVVLAGTSMLAFGALAAAWVSREPRSRLSRWLTSCLVVFAALLLVGLVDSLGQTLYRASKISADKDALVTSIVGAISGLMALGAAARKLVGMVGEKRRGGIGLPVRLVALVAALALSLPLAVGWSAVAHAIVWGDQPPVRAADTPGAADACPPALPSPSPACTVDDAGQLQLTWGSRSPEHPESHAPGVNWCWALIALGAGSVLSLLFGRTYSFLNNSSMASLYAARLVRAYLGASNKERIEGPRMPTTEMLPSDHVDMARYQPTDQGGPLHIINTTLNETVGGQSHVEEADRKGMNLALGPAGVSVAARHHALWRSNDLREPKVEVRDHLEALPADPKAPPAFQVFPPAEAGEPPATFSPELLDLGRWIAISGAAASTALGSLTSLGLSLLCGLLNVRLGHWWWSDVSPRRRKMKARMGALARLTKWFSRQMPVQAHLLHELTARFPGTGSRNWYLTDGGHFENTGVYELIRRRVGVIIVLDNGGDEKTRLNDVASLVRKARVDFATEIEFEDRPAAADSVIGSLADLGFTPLLAEPATAKVYATMATIHYPAGDGEVATTGKLLVVKPGLIGDLEPVDILNYRAQNPDFPQQTTADQFFDEAQWEAYRKLGDTIAGRLFDGNEDAWSRLVPDGPGG